MGERLGDEVLNERIQTDDESLGRRRYLVTKQRAVERSLERWRQGLKADWHLLSRDEVASMAFVAGELWATLSRDEWEQMHFSKLGLHETRVIVAHADRLRHGARREETLEQVMRLIEQARVRSEQAMRSGEGG
ncbi:MAG: hypothetical protein H5T75_06495 [Coriobacteriia bacterium]|nr:hypothetical protein [Coriobacteriia bacterium]MDI6843035.1 hypothetical protein [Anaerosomatales bacterium]